MKKYKVLSIEVIVLSVSDVVTASIEETKNQYDEMIEWIITRN